MRDRCPFCEERPDDKDCSKCNACTCSECLDERGWCPDCVDTELKLVAWRKKIIEQAKTSAGFIELVVDYGVHEVETVPDERGRTSSDYPQRCKHCGRVYEPGWEAMSRAEEESCPARDEKVTYQIPKAPFMRWSLGRTHGEHLAPPWKPVSEMHFKLMNDDRNHTDFMVGAGMPFFSSYREQLRKDTLRNALVYASGDIQRQALGFEVTVLSGRGEDSFAHGDVVHPQPDEKVPDGSIIVIPHAGPTYTIPALIVARTGGAVISERGGPLSHLAVVGREEGLLLVVVKRALQTYPVGCRVSVDGAEGRVEISTSEP